MNHDTVRLFDLDFFNGTLEDFIRHVGNASPDDTSDTLPLVFTPNADIVIRWQRLKKRNAVLAKQLAQSGFILPDGFPVIVASRLRGSPLKARVRGSEIFEKLPGSVENRRFLVIGPDKKTLERVVVRFHLESNNEIQYVAPPELHPGSREFDQSVQESLGIIETFHPHYVFVCLGFPKQEMYALALIEKLKHTSGNIPWFFGLGASADFYSGVKKRAPRWMQQFGLEWFHRMIHDPVRLTRRYLFDAIFIIPLLYREWRTGKKDPLVQVDEE